MEEIKNNKESTADKAINLAAIVAVVYLTSILSGSPFAQSLGSVLVFGLFGMGVYRLLDKFVFKNKFSNDQSKFRQYAIGCVVISIIVVPLSINQGRERLKRDQDKFSVGESLGKLYVSCELSKYITEKFCPEMKLNSEFSKMCKTDIGSLSPSSKSEFDIYINSEKAKSQLQDLQGQTAKNVEIAKKSSNFSNEKLCDSYQILLNKTFIEEVENIKIKSN